MTDQGQHLYQIPPLTRTELVILTGLFSIGGKLVTRRVDTNFNIMWFGAELAINQDIDALVSLEGKMSAIAAQAREHAAEENPAAAQSAEEIKRAFLDSTKNGKVDDA